VTDGASATALRGTLVRDQVDVIGLRRVGRTHGVDLIM
jgi:hypothetical protein